MDNSTEVVGDHVGIWDRPKRTTTANAPTGGAYMIDVQNYMLVCRNIKVCVLDLVFHCSRKLEIMGGSLSFFVQDFRCFVSICLTSSSLFLFS